MNKNKIATLVCVLITYIGAMAQQEPITSQFIMNKMFINPGYTGYKEQATFTAMHRSQWVGFKGAPMTQVISFDTPLKKNQLAAGGAIIHDKLGPTSRIGIMGDFAYRTRLSNRATISWGVQASMDIFQMNLTDLNLASDYYGTFDEAFLYNTKGLILPNIGFGAYYYKKDYFVGVSAPKMLRPKLEKKSSMAYTLLDGRSEPVIQLMGGKMFKINRDLLLQGSTLIRTQWNAPMSIGLYCNAHYMKDFNLGLFYYVGENAGVMFQWQVDSQFKFGYSLEVPTTALIRAGWGSHELVASYALATKKKRIVYPRYF